MIHNHEVQEEGEGRDWLSVRTFGPNVDIQRDPVRIPYAQFLNVSNTRHSNWHEKTKWQASYAVVMSLNSTILAMCTARWTEMPVGIRIQIWIDQMNAIKA